MLDRWSEAVDEKHKLCLPVILAFADLFTPARNNFFSSNKITN